MNKQLENFARKTLLLGLKKCTEEQIMLFKRMYSHKDIELHIDSVVCNMSTDKLDWAMTQVQSTLDKSYV